MKQMFCVLLSLFAVAYAQKGRGVKISLSTDSARILFGKKGDAKLIRKPGGGIEIDSTYFDVEALKIGEMDLGDFIGNILKKEAKQIGLTSSKPKSTQKKPVCKCPKNVAPVCGKNGGTYGNTCMAKCAKTTVASKGPCKKPEKPTKKPKKTTLKKRYIPCNVNNGGCHKARKCTIFIGRKSKYTICSACAKPYINLGSTQCTMGEQTLGGENDDEAKNLKACTGECDADSQCAKGLKCFQRSKGEKIPGCKGNGGGKTWDYCYNPKGTKP